MASVNMATARSGYGCPGALGLLQASKGEKPMALVKARAVNPAALP
jgi:hypothetical protein